MKRPSLAIAVAASALVLSAGLVACGDDDETDTGGGGGGGAAQLDLTVGNLIPLTGDLSDFGPAGRKGADLAVQQINAAIKQAGVDHTVEVVHEDAPDTQGAVQAARKVIADGASCASGAYASTDTLPVARSVTIREGVMLISPASTADQLTDLEDDGLFSRTAPPDALQGKALADRMDRVLGGLEGKTINIGARNDLYGTGFAESLQQELEGRGATVGESVIYDPEQPSYNSEAAQIAGGNPDAFVIIDFPETFAKVGPALVRTGNWDPAKSFFTDGLASTDLVATVGREATEGMIGSAPGTLSGKSLDAFDKLFTQAPGPPRNLFDSTTFDDVVLCYLAAVAAGSTEGENIAAEIVDVSGPGGTKYSWQQLPQAIEALQNGEDIDYEGASGPIDWDENGDLTKYVYDISEFRNGKLVKLDTVEVSR